MGMLIAEQHVNMLFQEIVLTREILHTLGFLYEPV